jgi:ABC-type polysaccharide/polyol phosphate export permease
MLEKFKAALSDVARSRKFASLIHLLGWQDMRHRYRRSFLGPFWLVGSTAALVATICFLFGPMFGIPAAEYVPYVAAGMIVWNLIVSMVTESCQAFISEATMIRQSSAPLFTYVARVAWRNSLFFAHNLVIYPVALWISGAHTNIDALLALPGFLLVMANLSWMGLIMGILAARYRDLPKTIESVIPVMMFMTPIMWKPEKMPSQIGAQFVNFNPFYWLIDLIRLPMMGGCPPGKVWLAAALTAVLGWAIAMIVFARSRDRIVYWL